MYRSLSVPRRKAAVWYPAGETTVTKRHGGRATPEKEKDHT